MQLLIESDFERDWQLLDRILRKDTTQAADGLDLLRHILRRYPTVRKSNILETVEATCERMLARGEGEPRLGAVLGTNEWIYVPGMARPTDSVASFEIQRTEITNEQYDQCVQSGSCTKVAYDPTLARDAEVDPNNGTQPVVGVTWDEARAFCRWVGGDLPTIDQWAHAMLASDGSAEDPLAWTRTTEACSSSVIALIGPYPYGQCHPRPKGPASVCSRPLSNTLLGLCDMTGNVSEWVRGDESEARNGKKPRPALGQNWSTGRVGHESEVLPMTTQDGNSRESYIGFRCARKVR